MKNIANTEKYKSIEEYNMKYFVKENLLDSKEIHIEFLPANYVVIKKTYKTKPNCWNVLNIEIRDTRSNQTVNIYRNYHSIDFIYVEQNGQKYLITSEDYQGFAIINLSKMEKKIYIPAAALKGIGWCPVEFFSWDSDTNELVCEGCIWGCPYSRRTYSKLDLENPDFDNYEETWDDDD